MRSLDTVTISLAIAAIHANPINPRTASIQVHQAPGQINPHFASLKAYARRQNPTTHPSIGSTTENFDAGFWFANFTVGKATSLSLLIDTGSPDVAINPSLYKPSSSSQNLHRSGTLGYLTTQENGCGRALVKYTAFSDRVGIAGLASPHQVFGNITASTPPDNSTTTQFPHDGIVGFFGTAESRTQIGGTPFFANLCDQGAVAECRFGLAYGTSGTGRQVFGTLDSSLYSGGLSTTAIETQWQTKASITVKGKSFLPGRSIIFDSGTANVIGSQHDVKLLFQKLGIQAVTQNLPGCAQVVFGYYRCDAPPTVGLSFDDGKSFDIEPSAFKMVDNGHNNCTAIITGMDFDPTGSNEWLVGQAWFQGKYVDHNVDNGTMGFAKLKRTAG